MKAVKRFRVENLLTLRDLNGVTTGTSWAYYFASDSRAMAKSIAGGLKRINQGYRILEAGRVVEEWKEQAYEIQT